MNDQNTILEQCLCGHCSRRLTRNARRGGTRVVDSTASQLSFESESDDDSIIIVNGQNSISRFRRGNFRRSEHVELMANNSRDVFFMPHVGAIDGKE